MVDAGGAGGPERLTLSMQLPCFAPGPRDWSPVLDLARAADRAGIDRLVVSDHVVFGEHLDAYADPGLGGVAGGRQPTGPDGHWLEPLTLLSFVAATTERVRLGTAVLLAALRTPAILAKQAATIDVLSGGRLDLGVGVGWQREEYEACGLDFGRRGALLDRCLEVCRRLWTEPVVDYDDGDLALERIHSRPHPVQAGGVPIWVSGRVQPRTVDRLCRFGVGWIPWGDDARDPRPGIATIRAALARAGRDPAELLVQGSLPVVGEGDVVDVAATMEGVPALVEAGVTDFRLPHRWSRDAEPSADRLAEVVAAFRAVVGRGAAGSPVRP